MRKLVIMDGHSLAFRAFYALPLLQTKSGLYTNAAYGFTMMLNRLMRDLKPDYAVVAFDKDKKTFRTEVYREYKGQRQKMPVELAEQLPYLEDILEGYRIPIFTIQGYEADDIIGTLSALADEAGDIETIIVTGDRDAFQLISERTKVMITRRGITDVRLVDLAAIAKEYGLEPQQLIDVKALMGDKSDNIPGIPGVGEKTALKLIKQFGSLEEVYNNLERVSGKSLPKKLSEYREQAFLSKRLATIVRDLPLELDLDALKYCEPDHARLWEIFNNLEFHSLLKELDYQPGTAREAKTGNYITVENARQLDELLQKTAQSRQLTVVVEADTDDALQARITAMALSPEPDRVYYFYEMRDEWWSKLKRIFENKQVAKYGHRIKNLWLMLKRRDVALEGATFDSALAAYLLSPSDASYTLPELVEQYAEQGIVVQGESETDERLLLCRQADLLWQLKARLMAELEEKQLLYLYQNVEVPLAVVLANMEWNGVAVDRTVLEAMAAELEDGINAIVQRIYSIAGEQFNINSPKQLGQILFEELGLPVIKKTKTGYSTAAEVLEELAEQHELPRLIIEYRTLAKLKSTYVDGLLGLVADGQERIHTTFHQTVTTTGRLSSSEPNLQNIPIRLAEGRKIRRAFVPGQSYDYILAADYSQIELRILAHMSQDEILMQAFQEGQDIHARTAAEVFGVPMEQVTPEMRRRAKAVNFGIVYGISDYGLARDLGISRKEAAQYIESYFARYSGVKRYIEQAVSQARELGYVETLLHRRRYLPEIRSRNYHRRAFAERTAMNTPIQGSAADLIKLAMVKMQQELERGGYLTRMLLQVHDELIFEVPAAEVQTMTKLVQQVMQNAMPLSVPVVVDVKIGPNWYEMKEVR